MQPEKYLSSKYPSFFNSKQSETSHHYNPMFITSNTVHSWRPHNPTLNSLLSIHITNWKTLICNAFLFKIFSKSNIYKLHLNSLNTLNFHQLMKHNKFLTISLRKYSSFLNLKQSEITHHYKASSLTVHHINTNNSIPNLISAVHFAQWL